MIMPRIRRQNLPPRLLAHLLDRIRTRHISADQLGLLAEWLDSAPEVPAGRWFKPIAPAAEMNNSRLRPHSPIETLFEIHCR